MQSNSAVAMAFAAAAAAAVAANFSGGAGGHHPWPPRACGSNPGSAAATSSSSNGSSPASAPGIAPPLFQRKPPAPLPPTTNFMLSPQAMMLYHNALQKSSVTAPFYGGRYQQQDHIQAPNYDWWLTRGGTYTRKDVSSTQHPTNTTSTSNGGGGGGGGGSASTTSLKSEDLSTSTVMATKSLKVESTVGNASVAALLGGDEAGCSDYEEELMDEDGRIPQEGDPDFVETTCRWGSCQCQFDSQDELVKVRAYVYFTHTQRCRVFFNSLIPFGYLYRGQISCTYILCACVCWECTVI